MNKKDLKSIVKIPLKTIKKIYFKNSSKLAIKRIGAKKNSSERIKVGFFVQMPEVWDKQLPVFEGMLKDERFDPFLIVLPQFDISSNCFNEYGEELEYFKKLYDISRIIIAYNKHEWINLERLNFNYIFYINGFIIYLSYENKKIR